MKNYRDKIEKYIESEKQALESLPKHDINEVMNVLENARLEKRRIFVCGNGGSASTASHLECDFNKGISYDQDVKYDIECLSDNIPMLMAIANDISYEDIYLTEADMASYSYTTSFDGEGAITSAIDYVVSEDHPKLYMTEGHGEAEVSAVFAEQIEKQNIETVTFTLLNSDTIPEDADVVLIHAPASDISKEEKDMLAEYTKNGGKLMVMAGPAEDGVLTNLYSLLGDYGVEAAEGIVAEGDRNYYAFRQPYILLPDMAEHEITNPLIEGNYYAIMPIAQGLTVTDTTGSVTQLLTTSETAYSKAAGYAIETYEKEEGDVDGPFATAVAVDCGSGGRMVWFASSNFLDDMYNAYSSGANLDLGMNALSFMIGEREAVAIRSKSLNYSYLTINESAASYLKVMMIGVFPLAFLGYGVYVIVSRRRRQNETV